VGPILEKIGQIAVYMQGMERRAQRRKSPWNLLLALFAIVLIPLIWFILVKIALTAGLLLAGFTDDLDKRSNLAAILVVIPLFFVSLPLAGLVINRLVKLIPRALEVFDREAEGDDLAKIEGRVGPKFKEAQTGLKIAAAIVSPLTLISLFAALLIK
jgi:hypothetical protein